MISFEAVATLAQSQELRVLRNECREFMTGSTAEISEARQRVFFGTHIVPGLVHAWLLRRDGKAVAYTLLRPAEDGALWMSCGVAAAARGSGLGTLAVSLVTAMGHHLNPKAPVRLQVWVSNTRARRCYVKAGYVTESVQPVEDGRLIETMAHR